MPTDEIQTEHPEPDSPSSTVLSHTAPISESWISAPHRCDMHLNDDRWAGIINDSLENNFWQMVKAVPEIQDGQSLSLGFIWTDAEQVTRLNHDFRDKDKPTNVLSFPDGEIDPETGDRYLGDIFLCWDVMAEEATKQGISMEHHTLHLMLHGVLHLLGYDHIDQDDAVEMESLETRLLALTGIADPYSAPLMPKVVIS